ncbi:hypothetical protein ANO11243_033530 [Dothideomycetidae sp. 11243]|nr:hypothetical protein ANO11243_033530 [fungal sp. No.11243]
MCAWHISVARVSFEHYRTPLGINEASPRISWRLAGTHPDWEQSGYDIEIRTGPDGVPEIFSADSSESILVPWPSAPLSSGESAAVRVRARGAEDQPSTPWSAQTHVETGLFHDSDWVGASVIGSLLERRRSASDGESHRPLYFRKQFDVSGRGIQSARLYITALGVYEAEINGKKIDDAVLAPGWQSYQNRHAYHTYNVTQLLAEGKNAIGVVVGEGWYAGNIGWADDRNIWGDRLGVRAVLKVSYDDGTTLEVPTDTSWSSGYGPIVRSELYHGESYDSRLEQPDWSSAMFDDTEWAAVEKLPPVRGKLVANDAPQMRPLEELKPKAVFKSKSGKTIVDFGQNLVGWVKLNVNGEEGQSIRLVHTEVLEDGEVATRPLRRAKATDEFVLNGKHSQSLEPHFTYHGFQYVQVEGWPSHVPLNGKTMKAVVIFADMEPTGQWKSSNILLNKLHENVIWSMRGNFLTVPTDCPQRDERLGWTGDAYAFGPTANFLYDTAGFWRAWYKDLLSEQFQNEDKIVPFYIPQFEDTTGGGPSDLYQAFGDLEMLGEQYVSAQAWIDTAIPRNKAGLWDRSAPQFGDWLDPAAPPDAADQATTSKDLVSDAYLVEMTNLLLKMAAVLGRTSEAKKYSDDHMRLKAEYSKAWIDKDTGHLAQETQTALALSLRFNLFNSSSSASAALHRLQTIVAKNAFKVGTGFAGTPHLGFALSDHGAAKSFYAMLLQTENPGWLYQVVHNATTTWERWDSMLPDGRINPGSMTSFNHYAFGSVAAWLHAVPGGLKPRAPGWREIDIAPVPGGGLTWCEARFESPYGLVGVKWRIDEEGFGLETIVPPNTRAWVKLPGKDDVEVIGSGTRKFHVKGFKVVP